MKTLNLGFPIVRDQKIKEKDILITDFIYSEKFIKTKFYKETLSIFFSCGDPKQNNFQAYVSLKQLENS